ncbi:helix-turn-helix transcriptional regulator [Candidatus Woesearchaeota archaeon]|nr:MAG: ArsR family transcriptional regulator [archaeon GW2011_AR18]MBS3162134.1 helix-turn-helix transcriptional regulator [Candidatus Woesearchaeota archaeon]HIH25236.1 helix-turn-helix transcriptional regulator [Nanoarchaeota archaeon]
MITKNMLGKSHEHCLSEKDIYGSYKIFFGTLVSEPRLRIINMLRKEKKNVTQIIKELGMNQTAVSHDLARLKKCGFVKSEIEGKYRYYKLNKKTINPLMELIDEHMSQYCVHILHGKTKNKEVKK